MIISRLLAPLVFIAVCMVGHGSPEIANAPDFAKKPTLVYTGHQGADILRKLNRIRLSSINYDHIPLAKALTELSAKTQESDPEKKGIVFTARSTNTEPFVTLTLRNVLASDVLDAIIKVTEPQMTYFIEETGIVVSDRGTEDSPKLISRTFHVDSTATGVALEKLGFLKTNTPAVLSPDSRGVLRTNTTAPGNIAWRDYFATKGVDLNPPAYVFYADRRGMLLVRAREEDLKIIADELSALNLTAKP